MDKMRGGGGRKMSVFVHAQVIKTVHAGEGGWGQIMEKFCPRKKLLNAPLLVDVQTWIAFKF